MTIKKVHSLTIIEPYNESIHRRPVWSFRQQFHEVEYTYRGKIVTLNSDPNVFAAFELVTENSEYIENVFLDKADCFDESLGHWTFTWKTDNEEVAQEFYARFGTVAEQWARYEAEKERIREEEAEKVASQSLNEALELEAHFQLGSYQPVYRPKASERQSRLPTLVMFAAILTVLILFLTGCNISPVGERIGSDDGVQVWTDETTGCRYVMLDRHYDDLYATRASGITPRLTKDGKPDCGVGR